MSLPLRFVVQQRTCAEVAPRVPDDIGGCTCPSGTLTSGGGCLSLAMLLPSILLPALLLGIAVTALLIHRRVQWVRWHTRCCLYSGDMHYTFLSSASLEDPACAKSWQYISHCICLNVFARSLAQVYAKLNQPGGVAGGAHVAN
jgi:hypothetical protein